MPINITHPMISPPFYVQKTDESGWYLQIGFRDLMTGLKLPVSGATQHDLTGHLTKLTCHLIPI